MNREYFPQNKNCAIVRGASKSLVHNASFTQCYYIILLNSLHYAKYSLNRVFSRSFSVPRGPFSMLGGPGGIRCDEVRFPVHGG